MDLNYKKLPAESTVPKAPLIILHGLFGSLDNWMTLGRELAEGRDVWLVDLRNHGHSPHAPVLNYPAMAEDMMNFIRKHDISGPVLMGHSMGGKVAMEFAVRYPELLSKLVVVDIAPRAYPPQHSRIIGGLLSVDTEYLKSRRDAQEQLSRYVQESDVQQFLLKNLVRTGEGTLEWRINLEVIADEMDEIGKAVAEGKSVHLPALFIRGGRSQYIDPRKDEVQIKTIFPNAELKSIPAAGHWVHADTPGELMHLLGQFLD